MRRPGSQAVLLLITLLFSSAAAAQAPVAADVHVVAGSTTNSGAQNRLNLAAATSGPKGTPQTDVYIRMDLSRLPAGATADSVSKATLKLYVSAVNSEGRFDLYTVMGAWGELSIVDGSRPPLGPAAITGVPIGLANKDQYLLLDVTALVKAWLTPASEGGIANNGVALLPSPGSPISVVLDSKETSGTSHDAEIQIDYTDQAVLDSIVATQRQVTQEVIDRQNADISILAQANAFTNEQMVAEAAARIAADNALGSALAAEIARAQAAETAITTSLVNYARRDVANVFQGTQTFNASIAVGLALPRADALLNIEHNGDLIAGNFVNNHNLGGRPALFALHTGFGHAIHARNTQAGGRAGFFEATHGLSSAPALETRVTGTGPALFADSANPNGTAGVFRSAGQIISGRNAASEVFSVSNSGVVTAAGFAGDGSNLSNVAATTATLASTADFATSAGTANIATNAENASALGGASADRYARRDEFNHFSQTQNFDQGVNVGGQVAAANVSVLTDQPIAYDGRTSYVGGVGLHAIVTSTSGASRGVFSRVDSPEGVALSLSANNGGALISASTDAGGQFHVDAAGNLTASGTVTAPAFAGDGSALTNVTAGEAAHAATADVAATAVSAGTADFAAQAHTANNALALGSVSAGSFARLDVANIFNGPSQKVNGNMAIGIHGLIPEVWLNVGGNADTTAAYFITNNRTTRDNMLVIHTGLGNAIHVQNTQTGGGRAGLFEATNTTSAAPALETRVAGPAAALLADNIHTDGVAGAFQSAGKILSGRNASAEVFSVNNAGVVQAAGFAGDGSALVNVNAGSAADLNCAACIAADELDFDPATQAELDAAGAANSTALSSAISAHVASADHDARYPRLGITNTVSAGDAFVAFTSNGAGIVGQATIAGVGVRGVGSTGMFAIGTVAGIWATTTSLNGSAALFDAPDGGKLLIGRGTNNVEKFSVDAAGTVVASKFVGDGSGLTGVVATATVFPVKNWLPAGSCPTSGPATTQWQHFDTSVSLLCLGTPQGNMGVLDWLPGKVAYQVVPLPDDYSGSGSVKLRWLNPEAVSGTVRWELSIACIPDGVSVIGLPYSFPTDTVVNVPALALASLSATLPLPTEAQGCPAGALMYLRVGRTNGTDSGIRAFFTGAEVTYSRQE